MKLFALVALLVGGLSFYTASNYIGDNPVTKIESNEAVIDLELPKLEIPKIEGLAESEEAIKLRTTGKTIVLEKRNTLVFRGPVTSESVAALQVEANEMSHKLRSSEKIYLVLDTPGGSVFAGLDLIDHLRAIPQKIETITLFAASMGFQIVQNMDTRYITPSGTLMSHRARGGLRGQFDGEIETRYRMVKRAIDYLDAIASKRMKMKVKDYKKMIKDEYWVHGFDAEGDKAADELINVRCGKSMTGKETKDVRTFFGTAEVTLSKCPIIRGILGLKFKRIGQKHQAKVRDAVNKGFNSMEDYVEDYILTDEHYKVFP